mmetsp:Transcript_16360/g.31552  ORF Transcript_16360/g.31552 Transcript_16360/m.31552 type:complete len:243 (+) Transcript_16360:1201-1929(+)
MLLGLEKLDREGTEGTPKLSRGGLSLCTPCEFIIAASPSSLATRFGCLDPTGQMFTCTRSSPRPPSSSSAGTTSSCARTNLRSLSSAMAASTTWEMLSMGEAENRENLASAVVLSGDDTSSSGSARGGGAAAPAGTRAGAVVAAMVEVAARAAWETWKTSSGSCSAARSSSNSEPALASRSSGSPSMGLNHSSKLCAGASSLITSMQIMKGALSREFRSVHSSGGTRIMREFCLPMGKSTPA